MTDASGAGTIGTGSPKGTRIASDQTTDDYEDVWPVWICCGNPFWDDHAENCPRKDEGGSTEPSGLPYTTIGGWIAYLEGIDGRS
jgi:hypothetical protein